MIYPECSFPYPNSFQNLPTFLPTQIYTFFSFQLENRHAFKLIVIIDDDDDDIRHNKNELVYGKINGEKRKGTRNTYRHKKHIHFHTEIP